MATAPQAPVNFPDVEMLRRFSAVDYLRMIESGVLGPKDRVELIGGMIVEMSPQGTRHNHFLMELNRIFAPLWGKAVIAIQATAVISEKNVYDPDFLLLKLPPERYKDRHPKPEDIQLVVEAAESSLRRDQQVKLPVYAAAGIPEYWIADLEQETLIIHREPVGGAYCVIESLRGDDVVSPLTAPELAFPVHQLFE